jgi:hypothetical protein
MEVILKTIKRFRIGLRFGGWIDLHEKGCSNIGAAKSFDLIRQR